jgi:hypothetical protein
MSRDLPSREKKKPKKDSKKAIITPSTMQPMEVEVVRKHRKKDEGFAQE